MLDRILAGLIIVLLTPLGWIGMLCLALLLWAASVLVRAVG